MFYTLIWRMNVPPLASVVRYWKISRCRMYLLRVANYQDWHYVRPRVPWKFIVSKARRRSVAMKKYEMESCQEEFSVTVANGNPRTFIRDFVTLSRLCFKPSSWRTVFTISWTVDQIKVKLCNSFAASLSFSTVPLLAAVCDLACEALVQSDCIQDYVSREWLCY